eukprot:CAMPEP_0115836490 /NCGR_PEP_ID=MMETSP0287-20121206/4733_1 /TAXON_ID=412157 /ORGANISM="Chrysochromulina rotalis, Strain UIO044" /LENGTH=634 /DNA_ID=CAMNT_0003289973 /DNA_START=25 /DNA_END=1929 /DNA_ORIENTATION=+
MKTAVSRQKRVLTEVPGGAPPFPKAPYANAVEIGAGKLLFIAGQVGVKPDWSPAMSYTEQCTLVCCNIKANLDAVGMKASDIVKWTIFLSHTAMNDDERRLLAAPLFAAAKDILGLGSHPAVLWTSTLVWVHALAMPELKVEVDLICCAAEPSVQLRPRTAVKAVWPKKTTVAVHQAVSDAVEMLSSRALQRAFRMPHVASLLARMPIIRELPTVANWKRLEERGYNANLVKRGLVPPERLLTTEGRMYKFDVMRLLQPLDVTAERVLVDVVFESCAQENIFTGIAGGKYLCERERTSFSHSELSWPDGTQRSWVRELKAHVLHPDIVVQMHAFTFEHDGIPYAAVVYVAGVNPQTKMNDGDSFSRLIQSLRTRSSAYFSLYPSVLDVERSPLINYKLDPMEDSTKIHLRYVCFPFATLKRWRGEGSPLSTNDVCLVKLRRLYMILQRRETIETYITISPRSASWFDNRTPGGAVEMIHLTRNVPPSATDRQLAVAFREAIRQYRNGDLQGAYYAPSKMQSMPKPVLPVWSIVDGNLFVNPRNALRELKGAKPPNLAMFNTDFHHLVFPSLPDNCELYGANNTTGCVDLCYDGYAFKLYLTDEQLARLESDGFRTEFDAMMEGVEYEIRKECPG